jgi:hypothetical protein
MKCCSEAKQNLSYEEKNALLNRGFIFRSGTFVHVEQEAICRILIPIIVIQFVLF